VSEDDHSSRNVHDVCNAAAAAATATEQNADVDACDCYRCNDSRPILFSPLGMPARRAVYFADVTFYFFLPRDAMLARYMPSSCICLSVCRSVCGCHTPVLYQNG